MKKILLFGLLTMFLGLSANAQTVISHYGGMPVSMTTYGPGYMHTTPVVRGNANSPMARTYARAYGGMRYRGGMHPQGGMRYRGGIRPLPPMAYRTNPALANGYYNNYNTQPTVVTNTTTETKRSVSRLNKNYTKPQRSTYTRDGVTYYN